MLRAVGWIALRPPARAQLGLPAVRCFARGRPKAMRAAAPSSATRDGPQAARVAPDGGGGSGAGAEQGRPVPWLLFGIGGLFVYGVGTYSAMLYFGGTEGPDAAAARGGVVTEDERRRAYERGAQTYESEVCVHEAWMGIATLRKSLLQRAAGNVLEVAAGTGHNFPLYPASCSVTATDCSRSMVEVARVSAAPPVTAVEVMEAEALRFPARTFDTVVDTFGLCSYEDPVKALQEMARVCKSEQEGGRLLLLEHGRSWLWPVNALLDRSAPQHAAKWGCWWNRDIRALIQAAGLKVLELHTHHLGTTVVVVAAPPPAAK